MKWLPNTPQDLAKDTVISTAGRIKLLELSFSRIAFGPSLMPFVAMPLAWFYSLSHSGGGSRILLWGLAYGVFALALRRLRAQYEREKPTLAPAALLQKWQTVYKFASMLHGLGLSTLVLITAGTAPFEFALLLYIILAAITSANAIILSPVLGVYLSFFVSGWCLATALVYWAFPHHWQVVLPLTGIFGFSAYHNALLAHRFVVNQVRLEEHSALVAQQYKIAKDEAERALQDKNLFLTTASHDLRQPVHAMGMLIETIHLRNTDTALTPLLGDLKTSVRSVNQMFNSLLDLSKIEAGVAPPQPVHVDVRALVADIAATFREEAARRDLQLRFRWPRAPVVVVADPALLRQSLANLVHNALRYTPKTGVLVGARKRGASWQLEVWDTGIGLADEDREHIYSPFYRNQHAWRIDSAGHGLGLSVVARCAQLMGATYGLTSRLGRGSRFWLALPAVVAAEQVAAALAAPAGAPGPNTRLHGNCLVLEDDPQAGPAWATLLRTWGLQVRLATCASEAFALARAPGGAHDNFVPHVILCDQRLRSGESGFEILSELLRRYPGAHGAMVSGEFHSPELLRAESEGYMVLRKPLEASDLFALLRGWLALHNAALNPSFATK